MLFLKHRYFLFDLNFLLSKSPYYSAIDCIEENGLKWNFRKPIKLFDHFKSNYLNFLRFLPENRFCFIYYSPKIWKFYPPVMAKFLTLLDQKCNLLNGSEHNKENIVFLNFIITIYFIYGRFLLVCFIYLFFFKVFISSSFPLRGFFPKISHVFIDVSFFF